MNNFHVVCNLKQSDNEHGTFKSAFVEMVHQLQSQLLTRKTVPYIEMQSNWWIIHNGEYKWNWYDAAAKATKEGWFLEDGTIVN